MNFLKYSILFILALILNLCLYLLVPGMQLIMQRKQQQNAKPKEVIRELVFNNPEPEKLVKKEIQEIHQQILSPQNLGSPRPVGRVGGGLKIDLSPAGGEGQALVSGGNRTGPLGSGTGNGVGEGNGNVTYEPGQTDTDARMIGADPKLEFPSRAEREGISGYVDLTFIVNESGNVEQITVLKEEPIGYGFGAKAIESAKKLKFKPATLQKVAVRQHFKRRFSFDHP